MGVGKQNAGGDLGLHVLLTSPWEFLKTPFSLASPKRFLWVRNNDGKDRGKWTPLFPPEDSRLSDVTSGLGCPHVLQVSCSARLAPVLSRCFRIPVSASPYASQALGSPRPVASHVHPARETLKPRQVPDLSPSRAGELDASRDLAGVNSASSGRALTRRPRSRT